MNPLEAAFRQGMYNYMMTIQNELLIRNGLKPRYLHYREMRTSQCGEMYPAELEKK
jgi:hypothetical protein